MKTPVFFLILVLLNKSWSEVTDGAFLDKFRGHNFFSKRNRDDFTRSVLGAIIKSIAGSRKEMTRTGLKISVLVAKIISDAFSQTVRDSRGGVVRDFSPLDTLLRQAQVKDLVMIARDPNLMEKVTEEFSGKGNDCLQLLFCKLSPFVKGMQKSLGFFAGIQTSAKGEDEERGTWAKSKPIERMYLFLPGTKEFVENCDICDGRYPLCLY